MSCRNSGRSAKSSVGVCTPGRSRGADAVTSAHPPAALSGIAGKSVTRIRWHCHTLKNGRRTTPCRRTDESTVSPAEKALCVTSQAAATFDLSPVELTRRTGVFRNAAVVPGARKHHQGFPSRVRISGSFAAAAHSSSPDPPPDFVPQLWTLPGSLLLFFSLLTQRCCTREIVDHAGPGGDRYARYGVNTLPFLPRPGMFLLFRAVQSPSGLQQGNTLTFVRLFDVRLRKMSPGRLNW